MDQYPSWRSFFLFGVCEWLRHPIRHRSMLPGLWCWTRREVWFWFHPAKKPKGVVVEHSTIDIAEDVDLALVRQIVADRSPFGAA